MPLAGGAGHRFSPGRRSPHEVPLRRRRARELPGPDLVPARRRGGEWLLPLAAPRAGPPPRGRPAAGREDRGHRHREPADLRQPARARRAARPRRAGRPQTGRAPDAGGRARRPGPPAPGPAHHRQPPRPSRGAESARAALRGRPAGRGLAGRPQLDTVGEFGRPSGPPARGWSMSLRPEPIGGVPAETARVARAAFPTGTVVTRLRDEFSALAEDEDFRRLSPAGGHPGLAPWRRALVTVFPSLGPLSARRAAAGVRARID